MWWWAIAAAFPCGGLAEAEGEFADTTGAAALLEATGTGFSVTYQTRYSGNVASFGWVVPVSGEVTGVTDADADLFTNLSELTEPRVSYESEPQLSCGCSKGGDFGGVNGGVDVVASGFTGTYDWVALAADDAGALAVWLSEHGWSMDADTQVQHYLDDGWQFVAFQIAATPEDAEAPSLPPVTIAYGGPTATLSYPSVMLSASHADEQHITLYVRGDGDAALGGGWGVEDVGDLEIEPDTVTPEEAFADRLRALGAAQRYGLTWRGGEGEAWLSRFDVRVPPSGQTSDVLVTFGASRGDYVDTRIAVAGPAPDTDAAWVLLLPLGWGLRRRRKVS